jgi:BlaI family transcriptional regulator, penicillinase repressor
MPRPPSELLTDREAQIMEILWNRGQATAEEVRAALADDPHDSTVRTLLRVLKEKGYARITGRQPAVYEPAVPRADVQQSAARRLLDRFFGGSADELVMRLLEDEHLSAEQLEQLKKQFASQRRKGGRK